jgi:Ras-related protein Rab-8A
MVLVYDVTDEKTFHDIEDWMRCIVENTQEFQIIQKVIVANKTDLDTDLHRVSSEDGRQLAAKHGIEFFEVSAKEGNGICEAFLQLTKQVLRAQSLKQRRKSTWSNSSGNDDDDDEVVVLHQIPIHAKKDKQCCKK